MKTIWITFGAIIIFVIGIWAILSAKPSAVNPVPKTAKMQAFSPAPDFIFKDYEGNDVSSENFLGKPYIVNSWASWCPFCVQELKDFAVLQEELGKKMSIVAVNRAETLKTAKSYTEQQNVTNKMIFLLDPDDSFYKKIGGFSMPETIFVNKKGEVVFHKRGFMRLAEMQKLILDLFNIKL